jgi:hypothetical protein
MQGFSLIKYFIGISTLQFFAAFLILIVSSDVVYFRYSPTNGDNPNWMIFHQVDPDILDLALLGVFPLSFILAILSILAILTLKKLNYHRSILGMINLTMGFVEIFLWTHFLIKTINFSQSLVSCDNFVVGKSLGCYIP